MLLFLCGWMRWYIALPLCAAIVWAAVRQFRGHAPKQSRRSADPATDEWRGVRFSAGYAATIAALLLVLVFLGMGGFVAQHWDYQWRNAVFFDLARRDWPVVYDPGSPTLLCYYIGFWLPASVVSRITGYIMPGDIAQLLWGWWGMAIGYSFVVSRLGGRARWWILPVMLFTGFCDSIVFGCFREPIARVLGLACPEDVYAYYMTFSLTAQLRMIFNQTIPLWVALPLLWRCRRDPGSLLLPASFLFLFSPLPCVGISVAVLYWLIRGGKRSLTFPNAAGLAVTAVTGLFYMTNNNAASTAPTATAGPAAIFALGVLFLLCLGVCVPLVWQRVRRNTTFWIMLATAFLLPFLSLGDSDDLGRRAAMPLTIMLTYMLLGELRRWRVLTVWKKVALPAVMLLGTYDACYMVDMTLREIEKYRDSGPKLIYLMGRLDDPEYNYHYNNFIATGESFYTRHMMRRSAGNGDCEVAKGLKDERGEDED